MHLPYRSEILYLRHLRRMKASIVTENISSCICGLGFEQKLATMQGYPVGSCSLPFVSHLNLTTRRLKGNVLRSLIVLCSSSDYIPHVSLSIFKGTDWSAWNRSLCLATHAVILNRLDGFAKPRSSTKGEICIMSSLIARCYGWQTTLVLTCRAPVVKGAADWC